MAIAAAQISTVACAKGRADFSHLDPATQWINSPTLTDRELQGKVVLINFWTYSCINWRRQLPYVRAWSEQYREHGLVVVGVHAPEFSFELNPSNVQWAANDMRIRYPIAIDNNHSIWRAFNNEYWPALYFIDAKGRMRHRVFGEGQYDQSEALIRRLLTEAGANGVNNGVASVDAHGAELAADWKDLRSEENYLGYERTENFASPGGIKTDKAHVYNLKDSLELNHWALSGNWTAGREAVVLNQPDGDVAYCFHARDLKLVLGPTVAGRRTRFRVLIDGKSPDLRHGVDVDEQGNGIVVEPRMYQLIRQELPIMDRQFEIHFFDSGVAAYSFIFG